MQSVSIEKMEDSKMGWDYTHATHYTNKGTIDRKAEIDPLYNWQDNTKKVEVVKSALVGSTYYAALRITHIETNTEEITAL
jgi:hypothetical protein